jgi:3',5'-cyclic AMP phosphodiesterase CpdA
MPFHLPPISRRRFLAGSVAAAASLAVGGGLLGADQRKRDPNRLCLFSDIHIAADKAKVNKDVNMWEHFEKARAEVLALDVLPSMLFVNGDLALDAGFSADYAVVTEGLAPFREAGLPIHLNMGNHDNRENFWKSLLATGSHEAVEGKHVSVVETPHADWVLLDSLEVTKQTPGLCGPAQLEWLTRTLDARKEKPCVVMVHHNPQFIAAPATTKPTSKPAAAAAYDGAATKAPSTQPLSLAAKILPKTSGLKDTTALLKILLPRKQVKALLFGHTHKWVNAVEDGLPLINLPTVAYPFAKGDPAGWVDCQMRENGMKLQLHTVDPKHPQQGDVLDVKWRG